MSEIYLSKSDFLCGLQCSKMLWILKHDPDRMEPTTARQMVIFQKGHEVGDLATQLFPGGSKIKWEDTTLEQRVQITEDLMLQGEGTIYEATFAWNGLHVMVDILHKCEKDGHWEMYEVKSATDLRDHYIYDAGMQYLVLKKCGIRLERVFLTHLDKYYTRGHELNIQKLFTHRDITEAVRDRQKDIKRLLEFQKHAVNGPEPDIPIGPHCNSPYQCGAKGSCWSHIPAGSIFEISHLSGADKFDLYSRGLITQKDVQGQDVLSPRQEKEVKINLERGQDVSLPQLKNFLEKLTYPLYLLDFESFQQAIPQFPATRPYMQIPFQYSLHILQSDGSYEHRELLAKEGQDPRDEIARGLVEDIPTDVMLLAYNRSFERMILKSLAHRFPIWRQRLSEMAHNLEDLLTPFQKRMVYHHAQHGSNSIKEVLPAWVPEMKDAYTGLEGVHEGSQAMAAYAGLTSLNEKDRAIVKEQLLRYCEMDTLAMVKLLERLKELV